MIAYEVDWRSDRATILYDPAKVSIEGLKKAVGRAGFEVKAVEELAK